MDKDTREIYEIMAKKEMLLHEIIKWLKDRNLFEQFCKETGWTLGK